MWFTIVQWVEESPGLIYFRKASGASRFGVMGLVGLRVLVVSELIPYRLWGLRCCAEQNRAQQS